MRRTYPFCIADVPADHVEAGAIAELAEAQQERRILLLLLPALSLTTLLLTKLQVKSSLLPYSTPPVQVVWETTASDDKRSALLME